MRQIYKILLLATFMATCVTASATTMGTDSSDKVAMDQALAAMCGKSIVLLGEATHGGGHADVVKAELVKQLVSQCGFEGVLFEASFYEFFPILRSTSAKRPISPELIGAAVGGYWKFDREMQTLFDFLAIQVNAGKVEIGGLDFQAGGFEQPYSNEVMFAELTTSIPAERRDFCKTLYRARVYGENPPSGMSNETLKGALDACLAEISFHADELASPSADRADQLNNLKAWLATDGRTQPERIRARDQMMAVNASRFINRKAKPAKVIVLAHNGHAARTTSALSDYNNSDNLGAALSRQYGDKMFSMATTACGGEYRWSFGSNKAIPPSPADSLEAKHCNRTDSVFIDSLVLKKMEISSSGVFGHSYMRAKWGDAFDGVFVLNVEFAPHSSRP